MKMPEWVKIFLNTVAGDLFVQKTMKADNEEGSTSVSISAGKTIGAELRGHLFGLGREDEASFQQALGMLPPPEREIIVRRMKTLGDPEKADTPQTRAFRLMLVQISDAEGRVKMLRSLAEFPEEGWADILEVTGATSISAVSKTILKLQKYYDETDFNSMLERLRQARGGVFSWLKKADANGAQNVDRFADSVSTIWSDIQARRAVNRQGRVVSEEDEATDMPAVFEGFDCPGSE